MDLVVRDLVVEYSAGGYMVRPIDGLNLRASSGELVVVIGPSGCGKTTLLSCLAGILTPTRGGIRVGDTAVHLLDDEGLAAYRLRTVGVVFQAFNLIASLTAAENVAVPLWTARMGGREARRRALALLDDVGLGDRARHRPGELSGGQQQRVAVARALAHDPPLLLADEPTAHLDYIQVEGISRLLRRLAAPGRLVVVVTHDERLLPLADRIVELSPREAPEGAAAARTRRLDPGELLFAQGDRSDLVYLVETGHVELTRTRPGGGEELLAVCGPGDYFGELGPLMGLPRSAGARAREAATLTALSVREFRETVGGSRVNQLVAGAGQRGAATAG